MRNHEIEAWALGIIDRVIQKQPIEDDRVELKAEWPDALKAARRIAGHANAARGEPILWLIGVDEKAGAIPGVSFHELGSWHASVVSGFDELAPELVSLSVPSQGVTVAVMYFETDRVPFVVKNSAGGAIQREVPWRDATAIKSATRSQLLRLLSPLQKLPLAEVLGALVIAEPLKSQDVRSFMRWEALVALFVTQPANQQSVFSGHKCRVKLTLSNGKVLGPFTGTTFRAERGSNIKATENAAVIDGSGLFEARMSFSVEWNNEGESFYEGPVQVEWSLHPAGHERSIWVAADLPLSTSPPAKKGRWGMGRHTFLA